MTDALHNWVMGICAMSLISSIAMAITPSGKVKKTVTMVCGMGMIVVLVGPIVSFDFDAYAQYMNDYNFDIGVLEKNLDNENERLTRTIIQKEVSAYILDKADSFGAEKVTVSVGTQQNSDGEWYPWEVTIEGKFTSEQQGKLAEVIESDLGVPADRQYWSTADE